MATSPDLHSRFCTFVVAHPDITNATARICAWLIGALTLTKQESISLSYRQIRDGFYHSHSLIAGTGSHIDTVKASIEWLEEKGAVKSSQGEPIGFGKYSRVYTVTL